MVQNILCNKSNQLSYYHWIKISDTNCNWTVTQIFIVRKLVLEITPAASTESKGWREREKERVGRGNTRLSDK